MESQYHNVWQKERGMEFSCKDFKVGKCEGEKVVEGDCKIQQVHIYANTAHNSH